MEAAESAQRHVFSPPLTCVSRPSHAVCSASVAAFTSHELPSPPQTPQTSFTTPLLTPPSQPVHVELSPAQTAQASTTRPLFGRPSQPAHVELSPLATPQPSWQEVPSPPGTPHASSGSVMVTPVTS